MAQMPPAAEPELILEPDFWELHGKKILAAVALVIVGIAVWGIWQFIQANRRSAAEAAFASASTAEEYRSLVESHRGTVVAGNARLLLAQQLRSEGKPDEAIALLQELVDRESDHALVSGAALGIAETLAAAGRHDEAVSKYDLVATRYGNTYAASLAAVGKIKSLIALGRIEDARRLGEDFRLANSQSIVAMEVDQILQTLPASREPQPQTLQPSIAAPVEEAVETPDASDTSDMAPEAVASPAMTP
jgi:predicted negative regulator of RcsB-dependent stress response